MTNETKYAGFWRWEEEMNRLDLWPRMDDAFADRALEGKDRGNWQDDMAAAQEAFEKDAG
jgi:hypothetical protein